jgi:hypothetical protein
MTQACDPCPCGGQRNVYRKRDGVEYITRYRRCQSCGQVSKTIQRVATVEDIKTLFHQYGSELVTPINTISFSPLHLDDASQ